MSTAPTDYYEFLQISPNADVETIHRVYKFLAARLHPDNMQTGDSENFQLLKTAFDVLSDPVRRAEYDGKRRQDSPQPISSTVDFMDKLDGEVNRRLAVLAVLYYKRRTAPNFPEVTLAAIEERMGFPRDYLDFTMWYLTKKGYISRADNAQFTLTAEGVDYVELQRVNLPILNRLLTSGSVATTQGSAGTSSDAIHVPSSDASTNGASAIAGARPAVLNADRMLDRRTGKVDRRVGAPDHRGKKMERRFNMSDRRVGT